MRAADSYYSSLGQQQQQQLPRNQTRNSIPWSGLLSIFLALGCGIAALVIGLVSNGEPLNAWTIAGGYEVQPSVLLAIVATVGNALLAYAFAEGVTLSWWAKAQRGSTLRSLQAAYLQSTSVSGLVQSLPHFSRMAVASIAMLVLLMDAPLLQRASTIRTYTETTAANLTMPISTFPLPIGATGVIGDHSDSNAPELFHPMFARVVQQYNARADINVTNTGCVGRCETEIIAPGWDVGCENGTFPYRLMDTNDLAAEGNAINTNRTYNGPARIQTMFETNVTMSWEYWNVSNSNAGSFQLHLYNMYKQTADGNGTMAWRNCTLKEALVRYPVTMINNTVSLGDMQFGENRTTQQIYRTYEGEGQLDSPSSVGGFWLALHQQYSTQANISLVAYWTRITTSNAIANTYITPSTSVQDLQYENVTWTDPMDDMLATIHELSLRTAITATNTITYPTRANPDDIDLTVPATLTDTMPYILYPNLTEVHRTLSQTVNATVTQPKTVYHTRGGWLAGGFAVMVLACLAILPTYWGFWRLRVKVTMSPLEVAKAFDAPLLRDRGFDGMRVQFGVSGMEKIPSGREGSPDPETGAFVKPGMGMMVVDGGDPGVPVYHDSGERRMAGFRAVPQDQGGQ